MNPLSFLSMGFGHARISKRRKLVALGTPAELRASIPDAQSLEDVFISLTGRALRE